MTEQESLREAAALRFRFQMNNRLRLESLAALSKVFRDFGEPIQDELLSSIVFAVPQELLGEYSAAAPPSKKGNQQRPPIPNGSTKKRPPIPNGSTKKRPPIPNGSTKKRPPIPNGSTKKPKK